ncbi:hypothetical protein H7H51_09535 [Mycolicibacterium farcinogenes]|nr:hypothetical protein [Mycolicibacterium farcinogenes]
MSDTAGSYWLNARVQRWFVFSGVAAVPVMFLGLVLARVFPAHNATWSADRIVEIYSRHSDVIQLGCLLMMISFAVWGWWQAVISLWVWRMESSRYPVLTFATLILAAINTMVVEIMSIMYAVAAFRAGRINPEITLTLNDLAWFFYYYTWPPYVLWLIAIAIAILRDRSALFPRWLAWFTLAQVVTILPNSLQTFSFGLVGPFAWDGFVTCVVVASFHGVWTVLLAVYILKAISREEKDRESAQQPREFPAVL